VPASFNPDQLFHFESGARAYSRQTGIGVVATGRNDGQRGQLVDSIHNVYPSTNILGVILQKAQRVNPKIPETKATGKQDGVSDRPRYHGQDLRLGEGAGAHQLGSVGLGKLENRNRAPDVTKRDVWGIVSGRLGKVVGVYVGESENAES
jgi:hypothetical protein